MRRVNGKPLTDAVLATMAHDAVSGMRDSLAVRFARNDISEAAARYKLTAPFFELRYNFVLRPA